jgi:L-threonylcarbamoyladenylate synthase
MQTQILSAADSSALDVALRKLRSHQLIAFPTDTVYGLGAALDSPEAIEQLYTVKGRDSAKAIAVLVGDAAALSAVASDLSQSARLLAQNFWPGPLTLVVPRRPGLPDNLSSLPTIGVRMPNHPVALSLLNRSGPLAVTSANRSGAANTTTAQEVFSQLGGLIALILDGGQTPGGLPSTVVDCTAEELIVLRQGPITRHQLLSVLG